MRDIEKIYCSCGGYPIEVETTADEERQYGCSIRGCCVTAIECLSCHTRFTISLEAPEMRD